MREGQVRIYLARDVRLYFLPPPSNFLPPGEGELLCIEFLSPDSKGLLVLPLP